MQLGQYPIPWWLEWFIDYVENAEKQHLETSSEIKLKGIYVFPLSLHVHIYIYIQLQLWILLINTAKDNNEARVCTSNPCETKAQTSVCFWSSVSFFFSIFSTRAFICLFMNILNIVFSGSSCCEHSSPTHLLFKSSVREGRPIRKKLGWREREVKSLRGPRQGLLWDEQGLL